MPLSNYHGMQNLSLALLAPMMTSPQHHPLAVYGLEVTPHERFWTSFAMSTKPFAIWHLTHHRMRPPGSMSSKAERACQGAFVVAAQDGARILVRLLHAARNSRLVPGQSR